MKKLGRVALLMMAIIVMGCKDPNNGGEDETNKTPETTVEENTDIENTETESKDTDKDGDEETDNEKQGEGESDNEQDKDSESKEINVFTERPDLEYGFSFKINGVQCNYQYVPEIIDGGLCYVETLYVEDCDKLKNLNFVDGVYSLDCQYLELKEDDSREDLVGQFIWDDCNFGYLTLKDGLDKYYFKAVDYFSDKTFLYDPASESYYVGKAGVVFEDSSDYGYVLPCYVKEGKYSKEYFNNKIEYVNGFLKVDPELLACSSFIDAEIWPNTKKGEVWEYIISDLKVYIYLDNQYIQKYKEVDGEKEYYIEENVCDRSCFSVTNVEENNFIFTEDVWNKKCYKKGKENNVEYVYPEILAYSFEPDMEVMWKPFEIRNRYDSYDVCRCPSDRSLYIRGCDNYELLYKANKDYYDTEFDKWRGSFEYEIKVNLNYFIDTYSGIEERNIEGKKTLYGNDVVYDFYPVEVNGYNPYEFSATRELSFAEKTLGATKKYSGYFIFN